VDDRGEVRVWPTKYSPVARPVGSLNDMLMFPASMMALAQVPFVSAHSWILNHEPIPVVVEASSTGPMR
jgi:hypothetical protein